MKKLFFAAMLIGIVCFWWFSTHILQDVARRQQDAVSLVAPSHAFLPPNVSGDNDAGTDDAAPRWEIGFGNASTETWINVGDGQQDGKDIRLFGRADSDMVLRVSVMDAATDAPPTELVGRTRDRFERNGVTTSPIQTFTAAGRTWVGFRFSGTAAGISGIGMTFSTVDTAAGTKIEIFAAWSDVEDEACAAAFLTVLRGIMVRRIE